MSGLHLSLAEVQRALERPVPNFETVTNALQELRATDLGLRRHDLPLSPAEPIRQEAIYQHSAFSVGLFLLRAGQFLPLHDHPRMTVWLKVLRGRLRVRSFDWVEPTSMADERTRLARATSDVEVEAASAPQRLEPELGNLHEIRALEDTAFIDLFSPYYSEEHPCTYYRLREDLAGEDDRLVWLEAVPEALAREAPLDRSPRS